MDEVLAQQAIAAPPLAGTTRHQWPTAPMSWLAQLFILLSFGCADEVPVVAPQRDADGYLLTPVPQKHVYQYRTTAEGFLVKRDGEAWQKLWPIGVNFGLALPGRSPGEFEATRQQIRRWLQASADMGANSVPVYTVQSPEFYRELRLYNLLNPDKPLFSLQGAWLNDPDEDPETAHDPDYLSPAIRSWFADEIDKVVDVVHGNRTIPHGSAQYPNPYGRAFGKFDADCSPWLLGYLVGREVEPYTIEHTEAKHATAKERSYTAGKYFSIHNVTAVEAFIVEHMDLLLRLEMGRYGEQRPIGFSNWPTLDPLPHYIEPKMPVSAEDTYEIDLTKMKIAPSFTAGTFISFHAYPYYPDFILYQPEYAAVHDDVGPNSYLGYLKDLRKFYKDYAVIISETGHPSSQGYAHFATSGLNHGGYNENEQAWANLRTPKTVADAGLDGACLFSLLDEWFKRAWITDRVSLPADRKRLWHNMMSPEQHFGLIALRPGAADRFHEVDGLDEQDWKDVAAQAQSPGPAQSPIGDGYDAMRDLRDLTVDHDAGFLHVRLRVASLDPDGDGQVDWSKVDYYLSLDTLDPARGDSWLDAKRTVALQRRAEFQLVIHSASDVQLLVDEPYDLFGVWHGLRLPWQQYHTAVNDNGGYNVVAALTNEFYVWAQPVPGSKVVSETVLGPRLAQETGRFRTGPERENSRSNMWLDDKTGVIEVRIPWNLLNVTDPSQRKVVDDDGTGGKKSKELHIVTTSGFSIAAVAMGGVAEQESQFADAIPAAPPAQQFGKDPAWTLPASGSIHYQWPTWDGPPAYHEYRKATFHVLRDELPKVLPATMRLKPAFAARTPRIGRLGFSQPWRLPRVTNWARPGPCRASLPHLTPRRTLTTTFTSPVRLGGTPCPDERAPKSTQNTPTTARRRQRRSWPAQAPRQSPTARVAQAGRAGPNRLAPVLAPRPSPVR